MKIFVVYKCVVDYNVCIQVKLDGFGVVIDGVKLFFNFFDEIVLEEVLCLCDKGIVSEVVVVIIVLVDVQVYLCNGLVMGVNCVIYVIIDQVIQLLIVVCILFKLIEKEQLDLVILGKQVIDDDVNQIGQMLVMLWGCLQVIFVSKLDIVDGKVMVICEVDVGLEMLEVDLLVVVIIDLCLNELCFIKLLDIMKVKVKLLEILQLVDFGVEVVDIFKII